jgi:uncharacterized protein with PIN domain
VEDLVGPLEAVVVIVVAVAVSEAAEAEADFGKIKGHPSESNKLVP